MSLEDMISQEPFTQRQITALKYCPCSYTELFLALATLIRNTILILVNIGLLTMRATWISAPTYMREIFPTGFFCWKTFQKGNNRRKLLWQLEALTCCIKKQVKRESAKFNFEPNLVMYYLCSGDHQKHQRYYPF